MILKGSDGSELAIYGGAVTRCIGSVAVQVLNSPNAYAAGSPQDKFVRSLVEVYTGPEKGKE